MGFTPMGFTPMGFTPMGFTPMGFTHADKLRPWRAFFDFTFFVSWVAPTMGILIMPLDIF